MIHKLPVSEAALPGPNFSPRVDLGCTRALGLFWLVRQSQARLERDAWLEVQHKRRYGPNLVTDKRPSRHMSVVFGYPDRGLSVVWLGIAGFLVD